MECAFDAQNLISISLRKIQSSRTQRGGIKLHKNLLVTYVLRNARQLCVSASLAQRTPPREDAASARQRHARPELTGSLAELADDFCCPLSATDSWQDAPACAMLEPTVAPPGACWSCADKPAWELPAASAQPHQKTVLDLDTHVVTTVTNGYFHADCCAPPHGAHGRKRKIDSSFFIVDPDFYLPDLGPVPSKRPRSDADSDADSEQLDSISNLISVLGSGGLSEFVSWQQTELEQMLGAQTVRLKHTLLTGTGWTRAIEAF